MPTILVLLMAVAMAACGRERAQGRPDPASAAAVAIRLEPTDRPAEMLGDGHGTKLSAIRADVPSTLSWRIDVPAGARVLTAIAFDRGKTDDLEAASCRARVEAVREAGEPVVVVEREVVPGRPWETLTGELTSAAAHAAQLRLSVSCPSAGAPRPGAARWRVPVVHQPSDGPNVVLVTVDTLRADHLGAYGYGRPTSPAVDALAARGLIFRHAESVQSATWPALTSLHTSLYPSAHGVIWNGWQPREGLATLAELLRSRGYATSAFITNMKRAQHPGFSRLHLARGATQVDQDRSATDAAIEHLDGVRDRRFFLWLHLMSPHADYAPPPPYDAAFARPGASSLDGSMDRLVTLRQRGAKIDEKDVAQVVDLYDGEVAFTDAQVGRLLDALRARGLERRTLVVFTADHGEDLHEHNRYFFHSPSMYSSSLAVPLLLSWPGVLPEGEATDHPASLVDVAPTVLSLLGLPVPSVFQGEALLEKGRAPRQAARSVAFSETSGRVFGARTPEWRLVYNPERLHPDAPGGPYPIGEMELYDLLKDPREQRNVAAQRRDIGERLTAEVLAWRAKHAGAGGPGHQRVDDETREQLRALGYIVP